MKRLEVIKELEEALDKINALMLKAEGKESSCGVTSLEDSKSYIDTWIKAPIESALELIKESK